MRDPRLSVGTLSAVDYAAIPPDLRLDVVNASAAVVVLTARAANGSGSVTMKLGAAGSAGQSASFDGAAFDGVVAGTAAAVSYAYLPRESRVAAFGP